MINLLKQVGKASLYFLIYLGWQVVTGFVLMMEYTMVQTVKMGLNNQMVDEAELDRMLLENATEISYLAVLFAALMALLTYWGIFKVLGKKTLKELAIDRFPMRDVPGVLLAAAGVYMMIGFGLDFLPFTDEVWEAYAQASDSLSETSFLMVISTLLCAPIIEEIVFRRLMFDTMKKAMPVWLAALISSGVFAFMHGQILWMTYTFVLGMVCCLAMHKTGSVLSNMFIHMFFNLFGGVLAPLMGAIPYALYGVLTLVGVVLLIAAVWLLWPRRTEVVPS